MILKSIKKLNVPIREIDSVIDKKQLYFVIIIISEICKMYVKCSLVPCVCVAVVILTRSRLNSLNLIVEPIDLQKEEEKTIHFNNYKPSK